MPVQCTCPTCGATFTRADSSNRRYCSQPCRPSEADRFWAKVDRNGPIPAHRPDLGPCWLWLGSVGSHGYGQFALTGSRFGGTGRRHVLAHHWTYEREVGPIPDGLKTDHLCHTFDPECPGNLCLHRRCVNPEHLEPVTEADNVRRGQSPYGKKFRQTHCMRGHQDWYVKASGGRQCRPCAQKKYPAQASLVHGR